MMCSACTTRAPRAPSDKARMHAWGDCCFDKLDAFRHACLDLTRINQAESVVDEKNHPCAGPRPRVANRGGRPFIRCQCLVRKKQYPQALKAYTLLANAG